MLAIIGFIIALQNKRVRDFDECSTTTTRKFVKLNDGTATPSIELTAPTQQTMSSHCDHLIDPSIVPAPDTNTAGMYIFFRVGDKVKPLRSKFQSGTAE